MRSDTSTYSAFAAIVLAVAALVLGALSLTSAGRLPLPAGPAGPSTVDISLVISGVGAAGEPAKHHYFNPSMIVVRRGDTLRVRVMNMTFASHGVLFERYGVQTAALPGGPRGQETLTFVADRAGVFRFRCNVPYDPEKGLCSPDHETQIGYLVVLDAPR